MLTFEELVWKSRNARDLEPIGTNDLLLAFDPGHTTGWAYFEGTSLIKAGQIDTSDEELAVTSTAELIQDLKPDMAVMEEYRVYQNRTRHHAGSSVLTIQVIGSIQAHLVGGGIPYVKQGAGVAKVWATDPKMKQWGMYKKTLKHANDAIRHGIYFLCFGAITAKGKRSQQSHKVG